MSHMRIPEKYADCDFAGWATRNDIRCTDGRTIRQDAFAADDGKKVPLVWQHQHDDPTAVLGHGYLENTPEGVRVYGYLNSTESGKEAKELVEHKDITSLSIWANRLREKGGDVLHGSIKEVSLVLAGANEGAYIDYPAIAHGEDEEIEAYIYVGEDYEFLAHSADSKKEEEKEDEDKPEEEADPQEAPKAEEKSDEEEKKDMADEKEKTVEDVINSMTEEQKKVMYYLVGAAAAEKEGNDDADDEAEHSDYMEENAMHFNAFDTQSAPTGMYLSHSDEESILAAARKCGSFKQAMNDFLEENELMHADGDKAVSGFDSYPATAGTGVEALFPEYHDVRPGAPELVTDDLGWVRAVLNKVHKSPFSRIRTSQVDVRGIEEIRARGYKKGKEKILAGQYAVAKRATDPQTVYVRSALNHDDIVDITDFDYVDYQYKVDRMQLETELARAVLIGDGRDDAATDKISPDHIRNIWQDADLYTIHKVLTLDATANGNNTADNFGANYRYAQAMEEALLDAKIDYRGTGSADMFCQQQFFNKMMLAKDLNGRRLYANKNELATALDVNNVYNVPDFANKTRTVGTGSSAKTYKLLAIIGNLADYSMGSTKGGEIIHRTQFDIDFNQEKSLIETRVSGATTRIYSFIVIEEEVAASAGDGD